jgi:hypothetical protein
MGLLQDRVVLVSGGTQGVGAAVARAAAREGAAVVVSGRRAEPGQKLAAGLRAGGAEAHFVPADVADVASALASVAATVERFGRIDSLVSAAGLTTRGTLLGRARFLLLSVRGDEHRRDVERGDDLDAGGAGHDRARQRALGLHDDLAGAAQVVAQVVLEHGAQAAPLQEQFVLPVQVVGDVGVAGAAQRWPRTARPGPRSRGPGMCATLRA